MDVPTDTVSPGSKEGRGILKENLLRLVSKTGDTIKLSGLIPGTRLKNRA